MVGQFPYGKRYWYPHMRPEDIAIWEDFIDSFPSAFETVTYDMAVGSAPPFSTVVMPTTGGDNLKNYQKKIDVVAFKGDKTYIIELKPRANAGAIGQVKNYERLYKRDIDPGANTEAWILTDQTNSDLEEFAAELGVTIKIAKQT